MRSNDKRGVRQLPYGQHLSSSVVDRAPITLSNLALWNLLGSWKYFARFGCSLPVCQKRNTQRTGEDIEKGSDSPASCLKLLELHSSGTEASREHIQGSGSFGVETPGRRYTGATAGLLFEETHPGLGFVWRGEWRHLDEDTPERLLVFCSSSSSDSSTSAPNAWSGGICSATFMAILNVCTHRGV